MGPYKNSSSVATLSAAAEMDDTGPCDDSLPFDADSHNVSRQNATKKRPKKHKDEVDDEHVQSLVDSTLDDRLRRPCLTMTTILTRILPVTCLAVALCVAVVRRAGGSDVTNALIVIDVQNCFTSGGTLEVADGDDVIPVINELRRDYGSHFDVVVLTQDWHCVDHVSFASQHPGHSLYEHVELTYLSSGELCSSADLNKSYTVDCSSSTSEKTNLTQVLWPDHCIINSTDAELKSGLKTLPSDIIIHKGNHCQIDSYSAFYDNGRMTQTELQTILKQRGVTTVYVVGLATDYCVFYSAKDALSLAYTTYVVLDATRGVNPNTTDAAVADMKKLGIHVINSTEIAGTFPTSGVTRPIAESWKSIPALALMAVVVQFYSK